MKKLLLSLGTVAAVAAPVASVIACGSTATPGAATTDEVTIRKGAKVTSANKTGFYIALDGGFNLYLPDGKVGTSVTRTDKSKDKDVVTTFTVDTASTDTDVPTVKKTVDGKDVTSTEKVKHVSTRLSFVLTDDTGTYYDHEGEQVIFPYWNPQLLTFLNHNITFTKNSDKLRETINTFLAKILKMYDRDKVEASHDHEFDSIIVDGTTIKDFLFKRTDEEKAKVVYKDNGDGSADVTFKFKEAHPSWIPTYNAVKVLIAKVGQTTVKLKITLISEKDKLVIAYEPNIGKANPDSLEDGIDSIIKDQGWESFVGS